MKRAFSFGVAFLVLCVLSSIAAAQAVPVQLNWLGDSAPAVQDGVNWGVPWPKGAVKKSDQMTLKAADGKSVAMQSWPLAYWPDGSIKWSGHAIAASATSALTAPLSVSIGSGPAPASAIKVTEDASAIEVDTGAGGVRCRFPKSGSFLIDSMFVGDRKVAEKGKLILQLEDRSEEAQGILRTTGFTSKVTSVKLEQSGPVRTVVKVEGMHAADKGNRQWLPFTTRFYFYSGIGSVRMTHTFIYDGDQEKDFIKGMGFSFAVPFKEELHNRHVRFAGDGTGVWCQPVRLMPGYRNVFGQDAQENARQYAAHLSGKRMPNLEQMPANQRTATLSVAVYNDMKLTQVGPDSFSIDKRTTDKASWLHVNNGKRSLGLAVLGDVSGGIAVGVKDFWQKYPASLEINGAASDAGEMKIWLWSPDAPQPLDMRTYDTYPHGLSTNYEDFKAGWGTGYGIAHTTDMTLWAFGAIPEDADVVKMAKAAAAPPQLVSTPEYYHSVPALGRWSLPDRSTPTLAWVEEQLEQLFNFYHDQVEERHWYGFWDFGDVMHNYDFGRHDWRYDVGGWAWANTELMPDMFLWYTFLRTGRADAYRMAEAMTRHTSEVDAYHIGPFAPMGTRHNVNHWGDGAKQPRASHSMLKRYMYYLSGGDERLGDLMREVLDADVTYAQLIRYNDAHYEPTDGNGGFRRSGSVDAPTPAELAAAAPEFRRNYLAQTSNQTYSDGRPMEGRYANISMGNDWMAYSINWATEWERTGDVVWRDRVMAGMKTIIANSQAGGRGAGGGGNFTYLFGGPEIQYEEQLMFDYPEYWEYFTKVMESGAVGNGNSMTPARCAAYVAWMRKSQDWGNLAWDKLVGTSQPTAGEKVAQPALVSGPEVLNPVHDPNFLGRSADWQLHGVSSVQWALNAIQTIEFAKAYLPVWEQTRRQNGGALVSPLNAQGRGGRGGRGGGRGGRGAAPATAPAPDPAEQ